MEYPVNKGAGKGVEFKGLTTMYLFILAGGLAAVLLTVIVLYLAGVSQGVCIPPVSYTHLTLPTTERV